MKWKFYYLKHDYYIRCWCLPWRSNPSTRQMDRRFQTKHGLQQRSVAPFACDACPSSAVDRGKIVGKLLPLALNKGNVWKCNISRQSQHVFATWNTGAVGILVGNLVLSTDGMRRIWDWAVYIIDKRTVDARFWREIFFGAMSPIKEKLWHLKTVSHIVTYSVVIAVDVLWWVCVICLILSERSSRSAQNEFQWITDKAVWCRIKSQKTKEHYWFTHCTKRRCCHCANRITGTL